MRKRGIRREALTERCYGLLNYLKDNKDMIDSMTPDTAKVIYKELKSILLVGKFYTPKLKFNVPAQFEPVRMYEERDTW